GCENASVRLRSSGSPSTTEPSSGSITSPTDACKRESVPTLSFVQPAKKQAKNITQTTRIGTRTPICLPLITFTLLLYLFLRQCLIENTQFIDLALFRQMVPLGKVRCARCNGQLIAVGPAYP